MQQHFSQEAYRWDDKAKVPYLSITSPEPLFITYENAQSIQEKINYVRTGSYGGMIIWDPSAQYFPSGDAEGKKNPQLEAVRKAAFGN